MFGSAPRSIRSPAGLQGVPALPARVISTLLADSLFRRGVAALTPPGIWALLGMPADPYRTASSDGGPPSTHRIGQGAGHSGPPSARVGASRGSRLVALGPSPPRTVRTSPWASGVIRVGGGPPTELPWEWPSGLRARLYRQHRWRHPSSVGGCTSGHLDFPDGSAGPLGLACSHLVWRGLQVVTGAARSPRPSSVPNGPDGFGASRSLRRCVGHSPRLTDTASAGQRGAHPGGIGSVR